MSDNIPFEIQSEIMEKLPVKSLLQFRSVSKQWKSLIDSPEFIKTYRSQNHMLVWYEIDNVRTYTSIIDDNTFPKQRFPLTAPEPLNLLKHAFTLGSVNGIICFYGTQSDMVVLWNPSVRKCVGIVIPHVLYSRGTVIGFGVCSDTSEYTKEGEMRVCGVWMKKDGVNQPFTKIYTIKVEGRWVSAFNRSVMAFRNNGEVVLNMVDHVNKESTVEAYEPSSGHINCVVIEGGYIKFFANSYTETLLLLDESNSIIR